MSDAKGTGSKQDPWVLQTPPGTSEYQMWRDEEADPPALVCQVGKTQLSYQLRCIDDLHAMLKAEGDWVPLGSADEQKPAAEGTVEAWGRSPDNPVGGWYGLKKGLRGRFRDVRAAAARGARPRRAGAQPTQQPHARSIGPRGGRGSEPPRPPRTGYIASNASYTVTLPPPCSTGEPFARPVAAWSESAWTIV